MAQDLLTLMLVVLASVLLGISFGERHAIRKTRKRTTTKGSSYSRSTLGVF